MKKHNRYVYFLWVLCIAIAGGYFLKEDSSSTHISQTKVALREVGHELLLAQSDSTSLVMPVEALEEGLYQLSFEKFIAIDPEFLVAQIETSFKKIGSADFYLVEVLDCKSNAVAYSFRVQEQTNENIIPCKERVLPLGCYTILVHWTKAQKANYAFIFYSILGGFVLFLIWESYRKKSKVLATNCISLGAYRFEIAQQQLHYRGETIALSTKETELLALLQHQPNTVIRREDLSKKIWEDKGVVVGRSLDTYISKLRKKLSKDPNLQIVNVHGVGYKLVVGG